MDTPPATRNLRLLLIVPSLAACDGGIAAVGRSLVRLLAGKADGKIADFRVLSLHDSCDNREEIRPYKWGGKRFACFGGDRVAFCLAALRRMVGWSDVAVFTHVGLASLLSFLPHLLRPASVTLVHGREVWCPLRRRHLSALCNSTLVVSNSEFTARRAREVNPQLPEIRCCHLGIETGVSRTDAGPSGAAGAGREEKDILIVGRMSAGEPGKGHAELISVMQRVVARTPEARLVIPGCGSAREEFRQLAAQSSARHRIVFTGFLSGPALQELYESCRVFAMPSVQDGFGLVYLEAMRAGKPCITSDADGGQEVVVDGETGFHVPPDDLDALTAALVKLLTDDALNRRLGENGRRRFLEHFTERHFHDRFWVLVKEAARLTRQRRPEGLRSRK